MKSFQLKTQEDISLMAEGGKKLAGVKKRLMHAVKEGVSALDIEKMAQNLISEEGAKASFMMVPGYRWATCININDGLVHGIPKKDIIFKNGDIVSVDIGLFYKGFHTDTSFSVLIGQDKDKERFLEAGKKSLKNAIKAAKVGKKLGDISQAIEKTLGELNLTPIRALVGHGIGRSLHENPMVPCYTGYEGQDFELKQGTVLAIEVMYAQGSCDVKTDSDGWTIRMKDGKISALFEETVAVVRGGPVVLTR